MMNKLNLKCHDRVRLINLGPEKTDCRTNLNGRTGSIVGIATRHIVDCYIVLLDAPVEMPDFTHVAVSIPECCIERI